MVIALHPLPLPEAMLYSYCLCLFSFPRNKFQHEERAFIVKFSAIEIYNEAVRDLLSTDTSPLRLLDDQEVDMLFFTCKKKTSIVFLFWHFLTVFGC